MLTIVDHTLNAQKFELVFATKGLLLVFEGKRWLFGRFSVLG